MKTQPYGKIPEVIFEDQNFVVLNKPAGVPMHPVRTVEPHTPKSGDYFGSDHSDIFAGGSRSHLVNGGPNVEGRTVVHFLLERYPDIRGVGTDPMRPGIVHRLDRDTSGVVLVARNSRTLEALQTLFKNRLVEKTYLAIVCGAPRERSGTIRFPIGRSAKDPTRRAALEGRTAVRGAREAETEYRVLETSGTYSLLRLIPKTGRTHQIRVHLKAIGCPVACDIVYGGKKVCCPDQAARHLLHAQSLSFSFPDGGKWKFEADPPEDFSLALRSLIF